MDCTRAQELFSDHLEGSLHPILSGDLERHLAACDDCRALREALAQVVEALRATPELEVPEGLAERAARAALARPPAPDSQLSHPRGLAPDSPLARPPGRPLEIRPAVVVPHWLNVAAAGFALIALGTTLAVLGPERGARAAERLVGQTVIVGSNLIERKDRLLEDVRLLGVVLSTAFEGRIERVNERVNDYKRLLERRQTTPPSDPKQGSETRPPGVRLAAGFRTAGTPGS